MGFSVDSFSQHLFWDVDVNTLDFAENQRFIITRVLQFGFLSDWKNLLKTYGLEKIAETAMKIKDIDKKTASFIALISDTPKENFTCYTTTQSSQQHWNF